MAVVQFFPCVLSLMHLQTAWMCCLIFTLIAIVYFFLTMLFHMRCEGWSNIAWIVAMCALVRFLAAVNKGVGLQINLLTKWLAALYEALRFFPRMYAGAGLQTSVLTELYLTPPWACLWRKRGLLHANVFGHTSHTFWHIVYFSPVWMREWVFKLSSLLNDLSHCRQLY